MIQAAQQVTSDVYLLIPCLFAALNYFNEQAGRFGPSNDALPLKEQLLKLSSILKPMKQLISYQLSSATWHSHSQESHKHLSTLANRIQELSRLCLWPHPTQKDWDLRRTISCRACIVIVWLSCTEEANVGLRETKMDILEQLWWLVANIGLGDNPTRTLCEPCSCTDTEPCHYGTHHIKTTDRCCV